MQQVRQTFDAYKVVAIFACHTKLRPLIDRQLRAGELFSKQPCDFQSKQEAWYTYIYFWLIVQIFRELG